MRKTFISLIGFLTEVGWIRVIYSIIKKVTNNEVIAVVGGMIFDHFFGRQVNSMGKFAGNSIVETIDIIKDEKKEGLA